jgi:hypothetical protein
MAETCLTNKTSLVFNFLNVEDQPLLGTMKASILTVQGLLILLFGLLIQARIYVLLHKQKSEGSVVAIDKLFKAHNVVNLICQPIIMLYLIVSFNLFPMIDYVGVSGCVFLPHILLIFTSIYSLLFPLTVALLRFLFIVCNNWTKWYGTNKLVNTILLLSFSVSLLMTLSLQFPVYDYVHGPFNYCRGRFEVLFNPTHSDPFTPGIYTEKGGR